MIHKICDECGKTEAVDFMVAIDDDVYCVECDAKKERATKLECPHCKRIATVYHMQWSALGCGRFIEGKVKDGCGAMVDKKDWKQQQKGFGK